jgi:hypothetical protein
MAYAYLTMLDLAKLNGSDAAVGLIEENINLAPEATVFPARTIAGTSFKTVQRTALPTSQFRQVNQGVEPTKSTYVNRTVECYYFDGQLEMDVAVAQADEMGEAHALGLEADGMVASAIQKIGTQVWYGTSTGDANGFPGAVSVVDSTAVLDAGGTTADTGSSVFGVRLGEKFVQMVFGRNSVLTIGDWRKQTITRSSKEMTAWKNSVEGWIGCQWVNKHAVCQLKDATADSGKTVTDAKLAQLLSQLKWTPDYWFMGRRSLYQLQSSRSPVISSGVPQNVTITPGFAVAPTESNGIPIIVTDSIIATEALS